MKTLAFTLVALAFGLLATAQQNPPASPRVETKTDLVALSYGQPSKKGRVIFGGLEAYGQVWRTGANEATTITFSRDVTFGGKPVKAGTYSLFTIPTENEWTIILNTVAKQWGAYNYDATKDVLRVTAPVKTVPVIEKLDIHHADGKLVIGWDTVQVEVAVQ